MEPHTFPLPGRFGHGFVAPGPAFDSGPRALEWAIFALLLVLLLLVAANVALAWSARPPREPALVPAPAPPPPPAPPREET